jgi:hypothetical protein
VSSSSPAFGWKWWRHSETSEWKRKRRMRPIAPRGSCSAQARTNTRIGRSVWSLPWRRLGGGRAAVARAWRAQETPEREGSRGGRGRRRRVGMCSSWRLSSGSCVGGERRWQEQSRGGSEGDRGRRSSRCQWDLFAISKKFRDLSVN